ncbi:hypothetical protein NLI96_g12277 [Meripilus lineatus]|uniref:Reverse transcriptase domain-containing protein n=1 Tax=Meripilus lineatus TaxID=2056292 RepID=A0AAD5URK7_9APHY|nr:hypothetical protein NLI96_g12277 [Physisporinus lineatus]
MKGRNSSNDASEVSKWTKISQTMTEMRIGVLALQETHLDERHLQSIERLYGRKLKVFNTSDPRDPTRAKGVAIVLNKHRTNTEGVTCEAIIPGRAMRMVHPWHKDLTLHILAVYAPNEPAENAGFWNKILEIWVERRYRRPDVILGDFNVVTDQIDRIPQSTTRNCAQYALTNLVRHFGLKDGWRELNPTAKTFTFRDSRGQSRLDRIYTTNSIFKASGSWNIVETSVPTDHKMTIAEVISRQSPFIGRGRWTMPDHAIEDTEIWNFIQKKGLELENNIEASLDARTEGNNPQTLYESFKNQITEFTREKLKKKIPKKRKEIENLEKQIENLANDPSFSTDGILQQRSIELQNKLKGIKLAESEFRTKMGATRYKLEGEMINKYWTNLNKEKKPRDIIYILRDSNANASEAKTSKAMAELGKTFFDNLQLSGIDPDEDRTARENTMKNQLKNIETKLSDESQNAMNRHISESEIETAIMSMENGKATGLDGIPYELWKRLMLTHTKLKDTKRKAVNIKKILGRVFNDIATHGTHEDSNFADGWICPIFKKKDRAEITNYRPITLLNTDYKILTKCLANRLAKHAPAIINADQAGFIKERSIFDQVKLAKLMIDYAEATEHDGLIVALDQEKAYDRIRHDYLWNTLKKFGIPPFFITLVQNLYKNAKSTVIINGVKSTFFRILRGVRQGDPLSCLLFNLAIEPLAESLRSSGLTGYQIPGYAGRLITKLFADDTTVYLNKEDNINDLFPFLEKWCEASGAKFNTEKTEIIPIGTKTYREEILKNRSPGGRDDAWNREREIPASINIAKEGEPTRILGAWIGNNVNQDSIWNKTIEKVEKELTRWKKGSPTFQGKRHIIQMVVGGITQYLSKVQGMPKHTEKRLIRIIKNFIWDEKKAPVSMDMITQRIERGGLGILDLQARNEAIQLTWLKAYLNLTPTRPTKNDQGRTDYEVTREPNDTAPTPKPKELRMQKMQGRQDQTRMRRHEEMHGNGSTHNKFPSAHVEPLPQPTTRQPLPTKGITVPE